MQQLEEQYFYSISDACIEAKIFGAPLCRTEPKILTMWYSNFYVYTEVHKKDCSLLPLLYLFTVKSQTVGIYGRILNVQIDLEHIISLFADDNNIYFIHLYVHFEDSQHLHI